MIIAGAVAKQEPTLCLSGVIRAAKQAILISPFDSLFPLSICRESRMISRINSEWIGGLNRSNLTLSLSSWINLLATCSSWLKKKRSISLCEIFSDPLQRLTSKARFFLERWSSSLNSHWAKILARRVHLYDSTLSLSPARESLAHILASAGKSRILIRGWFDLLYIIELSEYGKSAPFKSMFSTDLSATAFDRLCFFPILSLKSKMHQISLTNNTTKQAPWCETWVLNHPEIWLDRFARFLSPRAISTFHDSFCLEIRGKSKWRTS